MLSAEPCPQLTFVLLTGTHVAHTFLEFTLQLGMIVNFCKNIMLEFSCRSGHGHSWHIFSHLQTPTETLSISLPAARIFYLGKWVSSKGLCFCGDTFYFQLFSLSLAWESESLVVDLYFETSPSFKRWNMNLFHTVAIVVWILGFSSFMKCLCPWYCSAFVFLLAWWAFLGWSYLSYFNFHACDSCLILGASFCPTPSIFLRAINRFSFPLCCTGIIPMVRCFVIILLRA